MKLHVLYYELRKVTMSLQGRKRHSHNIHFKKGTKRLSLIQKQLSPPWVNSVINISLNYVEILSCKMKTKYKSYLK